MTDFVFPHNPKDAKELKEFIVRGANIQGELEVLKSDAKELASDAKEKFDMPTSLFNKYVKAYYERVKFLEKKEEMDEIIENLKLEEITNV